MLELIVEKAKDLNYKKVRLDTLKNMKSAIKLYRAFEFYEIDPYCYNPLENVLYMEKQINEDWKNKTE